MKLKSLISSLCIALPLLTTSIDSLAARVTLKLAHNLDQSHVVHQALDKMAKDLKEKSNGEINLRIYPSGQMGGSRETVEMIQNNALDMTKASASELEPFVSEFAIFSLPYLFTDENHFKRILYGLIGETIAAKTTDSGFKVIASYVAGTRSFYTKKPIHSPDDLKGLQGKRVLSSLINHQPQISKQT